LYAFYHYQPLSERISAGKRRFLTGLRLEKAILSEDLEHHSDHYYLNFVKKSFKFSTLQKKPIAITKIR